MLYAILVNAKKYGTVKISSEAYETLKEAQDFILSRSDNPQKQSEYLFCDDNNTVYSICEIKTPYISKKVKE